MENFLSKWSTERLENLATRNEKYANDPALTVDARTAASVAANQMRTELQKRNK